MVLRLPLITATVLALAAPAVMAAPQSAVISIDGMMCGADPHIVRKALADLAGVQDVQILLEQHTAIVSFDNAAVTVEKMLIATGAAGYPGHIGK